MIDKELFKLIGGNTTQNMGEQYEQVSSYIGYLFGQYQPYMWWVLLIKKIF